MEPKHFESLYPADTRQADIVKIVSILKEGNSCQLISLPGVGRATVLGLLAYNRAVRDKHFGEQQELVHFVQCNFSEIRKRPLQDVTKFLFLRLSDSLRERKMDEAYKKVAGIFAESIKLQDELVLFQGLKNAVEYLALEQKIGIVFLFDRFEEYVPTVTQEFFANLRVLRNQAKFRFAVVFSLSRPLDELIEPDVFSDFYEYIAGHTVFLSLYDEVGMTYRKAYLEKLTGKKVPDQVYKSIVRLTGGHAKLTKLSLEAVLAHDDATDQGLERFLLKMRTIRGSLFELFSNITPAERAVLLEKRQEHYLVNAGLSKEGKITIPLLERYLITQQESVAIQELIFRYDEVTQTILQGEAIVSDMLTASEFRFLRYLLEHPGTVLDRDQVIQVVWQEAKSTAGVSDEAVDQLVFRLRKKIEKDPKNPTHLVTVKGRGFSFTA